MASNQTNPMNLLDSTNATGVGSGGSLTVSGGVSIEKDTYIGGNVVISGTTTSFADNMVIVNANPSSSVDTGILFQRYTSDVSNNSNYSAIIYDEANDKFRFGYLQSDPNRTIGSLISSIPIQTNTMISDLVTTTNLVATNLTASNLTIPNYTFTTSEITASNVSSTNATFSSAVIPNLLSTNVTSTNVFATNVTSTNAVVSNVLATNVTSTSAVISNVLATSITSTNVLATSITSTNVLATNSLLTNVTSTNIITTSITSANMNISGTLTVVNITSTNLVDTNVSAGVVSASTSLSASGTSNTLGSLFTTNGNVGIGTTSPVNKLTLNGPVGSNGPHMYVSVNTQYPIYQQLNWNIDNIGMTFDGYFDNAWRTSSSNTAYQIYKFSNILRFNYANGSAGSNVSSYTAAMIVTTNGNIGMGTTVPSTKLHVAGSLYVTSNITTANLSATSITTTNLNVPGTLTVTNVTVNNFVQSNGSIVVTGNQNTIGTLVMNSAGNVGIATTGPAYTLDVNGTIARSGVPLPMFANGSFTGVTSVDIPTNFVNSSYNYCEIKMRVALATTQTNILIKGVNNSNTQLNPAEVRENTMTNTGVTSGSYTSGYLTYNMEYSVDGNISITIVKPVSVLLGNTSRAHFRSYSVYCNSGVGATRLDGSGFFESNNTSLKSIRLLLTNTSSASFSGTWSTINYY
jgi:hypothetical protein